MRDSKYLLMCVLSLAAGSSLIVRIVSSCSFLVTLDPSPFTFFFSFCVYFFAYVVKTLLDMNKTLTSSGHISPSMPLREARSVAERSEGPAASKSDCTGRNPGMTRLVRRSSATSGCTASLLFKHSVSACETFLAFR